MLTETAIRKAKVPAKSAKLGDERGLYLLCTPRGGKCWRFKYRYGGKEKLLALGTYPEISLAKAREDREEARRQLAAGIDPSAARQEAKRDKAEAAANNFECIAREWLEIVKPRWAAVYYGDTIKRFEAFVFPAIGRRPIISIRTSELLPLVRNIETRGTLVTAHKVVRACRQVFAYAIASGRCEGNPAADLRGALRSLPRAKHMSALSAAELPMFLRKIEAYDGETQTKLALRLLALTFVRTAELRGATWAELDLGLKPNKLVAIRIGCLFSAVKSSSSCEPTYSG